MESVLLFFLFPFDFFFFFIFEMLTGVLGLTQLIISPPPPMSPVTIAGLVHKSHISLALHRPFFSLSLYPATARYTLKGEGFVRHNLRAHLRFGYAPSKKTK